VLASTANLLKTNGWRAGAPFGEGTANFDLARRRAIRRGHCKFRPHERVEPVGGGTEKPWFSLLSGLRNPEVQRRSRCIVKAWWRITGLKVKAHPHMLRHACGYALANEGHAPGCAWHVEARPLARVCAQSRDNWAALPSRS